MSPIQPSPLHSYPLPFFFGLQQALRMVSQHIPPLFMRNPREAPTAVIVMLPESNFSVSMEATKVTAASRYNARITFASSEIKEATARIGQLTNRIGELEVNIANYKQQIHDTEDAIQRAIDFRAFRAGQFVSRQAQHQSVVDALDLILERLNSVGAQGANDETTLLQLAKIGKSNPIAAFVQVAAALDPSSWENVRNKIQNLRDATAASMVDDEQHEREEIANHNNFLTEMNNLLTNLRNGLALDESELVEQKADLADQEVRLDTNQKELQNATEGKAAKESQCQQWRDQYFADTKQRSEEISIVEQVQEIFANKLDTAQGYLRDRMEADRATA